VRPGSKPLDAPAAARSTATMVLAAILVGNGLLVTVAGHRQVEPGRIVVMCAVWTAAVLGVRLLARLWRSSGTKRTPPPG
jgi:hypothetical protein